MEIGLVPSLSQPGGNVTGMGIFNASLGTKRLELMKELLPSARVVGYLLNPADRMSEIESKSVITAGRALGIEVRILNAKSQSELDSTFEGSKAILVDLSFRANHFSTASVKGLSH